MTSPLDTPPPPRDSVIQAGACTAPEQPDPPGDGPGVEMAGGAAVASLVHRDLKPANAQEAEARVLLGRNDVLRAAITGALKAISPGGWRADLDEEADGALVARLASEIARLKQLWSCAGDDRAQAEEDADVLSRRVLKLEVQVAALATERDRLARDDGEHQAELTAQAATLKAATDQCLALTHGVLELAADLGEPTTGTTSEVLSRCRVGAQRLARARDKAESKRLDLKLVVENLRTRARAKPAPGRAKRSRKVK